MEVAEANLTARPRPWFALQIAQTKAIRYKLANAIEGVDNQVANLHALVATLNSRTSSMNLAEANLKRGEKELPTAAISVQEVDVLRSTYAVAKASMVQALEEVYAGRACTLGLPIVPPSGQRIVRCPRPTWIKPFRPCMRPLGRIDPSAHREYGLVTSSWSGSPKEIIAEFYKLDPKGDLDRIYAKLIPSAPAIKQAEAQLLQARRDLDQAQLNLRYTSLRAPFPGIVVKRYLHLGDFAFARSRRLEHVQPRPVIRDGKPGGGPPAGRRARATRWSCRSTPSPSRCA